MNNEVKNNQQILNDLRYEIGMNANTIIQEKIVLCAQKFTRSDFVEPSILLMKAKKINAEFEEQMTKVHAQRHGLFFNEYLKLKDKADQILKSFNSGFRTGDLKTLMVNNKMFHYVDERKHNGKGMRTGLVDLELNRRQLRELKFAHHDWRMNLDEKRDIYIRQSRWKENFSLSLKIGILKEDNRIIKTTEPAPTRIRIKNK
mgnify:CR=1 FL=1